MRVLKQLQTLLFFLTFCTSIFSQEYEWNVANSGTSPGERIVAVFDAGDLGSYDGIGITGTVIDCNGNWGFTYPTLSHFSAFVRFSQGLNSGIIQDTKTNNIILRFRKISATKVHLTANIPSAHKTAKVIFKIGVGNSSVLTIGNPNTIDDTGELIVSGPTYGAIYTSNNNTNVGIGTASTDAYKLAVDGTIGAREIRVETAAWSDFVFYDDYKLPTLQEVEKHIKEKGHLKDIPSAKEVEQNGIYLGEMNAKLLQKIEELTLYIITQEKKIKSLENQNLRIEKLENENIILKYLTERLTKIEKLLQK